MPNKERCYAIATVTAVLSAILVVFHPLTFNRQPTVEDSKPRDVDLIIVPKIAGNAPLNFSFDLPSTHVNGLKYITAPANISKTLRNRLNLSKSSSERTVASRSRQDVESLDSGRIKNSISSSTMKRPKVESSQVNSSSITSLNSKAKSRSGQKKSRGKDLSVGITRDVASSAGDSAAGSKSEKQAIAAGTIRRPRSAASPHSDLDSFLRAIEERDQMP